MESLGRTIISLGVVLIVVGGVLFMLSRLGIGIGSLPGDFTFRAKGTRVIVPLGTSILISVVLTVLINLFLAGRR